MQKDNKKTYEIALAVTAEKYLDVRAESPEEAVKEAVKIYNGDKISIHLDKDDIDYVFITAEDRLPDKSKITVKTALSGMDNFEMNKLETIVRKPQNIEECEFKCDDCFLAGICPEAD